MGFYNYGSYVFKIYSFPCPKQTLNGNRLLPETSVSAKTLGGADESVEDWEFGRFLKMCGAN